MKVMISQPMAGKTETQIVNERKKVTIKDIIMAANKATLYSLPWSSETWLDIVEEILIKLSIILYPFCFIYYIGKILFKLNKKAKDEEVN